MKNDSRLPLDASVIKSIAIIGSHADVGVLSGGGSAQVDPPGGNAVPPPPQAAGAQGPGGGGGFGRVPVWYPSSPLKAFRARVPNAKVAYSGGTDPAAAAALARSSEVAVVFVNQPSSEGRDLASFSLPDDQDTLDPLHLSVFDVDKDAWEVVPGDYKIWVGASSRNLPLSRTVEIGS